MDINTVRMLVTVLSFVAFVGIVIWAFSKSNQSRFEAAANLPFADEDHDRAPLSGANHG